ncbi:MAG: hypothetical protein K6T61_17760 [Bryobacteraceae bacterium]|nr:hypothetical protein [Bryobacteraceae bacterium]
MPPEMNVRVARVQLKATSECGYSVHSMASAIYSLDLNKQLLSGSKARLKVICNWLPKLYRVSKSLKMSFLIDRYEFVGNIAHLKSVAYQ